MNKRPMYLRIKNWEQFQPPLKSGSSARDWIRVDTHRIDDPHYSSLSCFDRGLLISIMEYTGRSGRWIEADPAFVAMATNMNPKDRAHVPQSLNRLLWGRGESEAREKNDISQPHPTPTPPPQAFLILCYEQKVLLQDKTDRQDETRKSKSTGVYSAEFEEFWKVYPLKDGKGKAFESWKRLNPSAAQQKQIIESVIDHLDCDKWQAGYIPLPTTFLNQRRFDDTPRKTKAASDFNLGRFRKGSPGDGSLVQ